MEPKIKELFSSCLQRVLGSVGVGDMKQPTTTNNHSCGIPDRVLHHLLPQQHVIGNPEGHHHHHKPRATRGRGWMTAL